MSNKEQITYSNKYSDKKDILSTLLQEDKTYSFSEVDTMISKFMKGVVK